VDVFETMLEWGFDNDALVAWLAQDCATIEAALEFADQAAMAAWDNAEGQAPLERLLLALQATTEELRGIGAALAAGEKGE